MNEIRAAAINLMNGTQHKTAGRKSAVDLVEPKRKRQRGTGRTETELLRAHKGSQIVHQFLSLHLVHADANPKTETMFLFCFILQSQVRGVGDQDERKAERSVGLAKVDVPR